MSCVLGLPDGSSGIFSPEDFEVRLPHDLDPERGFCAWMNSAGVARWLKAHGHPDNVKLNGIATDAVGRTHVSGPMGFDASRHYSDEWGETG